MDDRGRDGRLTSLNEQADEWVRRAQAGEAEALSALYRLYVQTIYRYLLVRTMDARLAEDLTGEVFMRMVEALPRYTQRGLPFGAWLFRIARDRLVDHYRRSARRPAAVLDESLPADGPELGAAAEAREDSQALAGALAALTEEQRDVIQFRFMEDYSLAETARVMDRSVNAIKALQHRALAALNRLLKESE